MNWCQKLSVLGPVLLIVLSCLPASSDGTYSPSSSEVRVDGTLHRIMHDGDFSSAVEITSSFVASTTFGVGAVAGLMGEITILDGRVWVSSVVDDEIRTQVIEPKTDGIDPALNTVKAALLVSTDVNAWHPFVLSTDASLAVVSKEIRAHADAIGLDHPIVFRVVGDLPEFEGHVIDGSQVTSAMSHDERHEKAVIRKQFASQSGTLVGFVSTEHEGVFTHKGESIHVHAALEGSGATIHVDSGELPTGTTIELGLADLPMESAAEWVRRADRHYAEGRFEESAVSFAQAITAGAKSSTTFFNAACSAALANEKDLAFEFLDGARERGFHDVTHLLRDTDLTGLHDDSRWLEFIARCEAAEADFYAALGDPDLRAELLEMNRIDQAVRRGESLPELENRGIGDVDAVHTARMVEIVAQHGWPSPELVGEDGARAAWLLVQHADANPLFQRECLDLMASARSGVVDPVDLAYLTDRVRVNEGREQLYGTQFWTVDGDLVPRPIEDEAGLDARRAETGLISMQEYTKRMTGREEALVTDLLLGSWRGEGELFGRSAAFRMDWESVLSGRFLRLTFENGFQNGDAVKPVLRAQAYYRILPDDQFEGTWFDSREKTQPLQGSADATSLTIHWGTPETEEGRTVYRLVDSDSVEVEDFVQKDGEWRVFAHATYRRASE